MTSQTPAAPKGFHSATHNYLSRLTKSYDPIIVKSTEEFKGMVCDVAAHKSIAVKALILPDGVTLSDPRLRSAKFVSSRVYDLPRGDYFLMPTHPYIADIDGGLVPPAEGLNFHEETRYQVLSESKINETTPRNIHHH